MKEYPVDARWPAYQLQAVLHLFATGSAYFSNRHHPPVQ